MIKTSDCLFNIQTYAEGNSKKTRQAVIRFGNDFIFYKWDENWNNRNKETHGELVKEMLSDTTKDTKGIDEVTGIGSTVWTNDKIGCSVSISDRWRIEIECSNPDYTPNFGGYCRACNDNGSDGPCDQKEMPWEVESKEQMWQYKDDTTSLKDLSTSTCLINDCYIQQNEIEEEINEDPLCVGKAQGDSCDTTGKTCHQNGVASTSLFCRYCDNADCDATMTCRLSLTDADAPLQCRVCADSDCPTGETCQLPLDVLEGVSVPFVCTLPILSEMPLPPRPTICKRLKRHQERSSAIAFPTIDANVQTCTDTAETTCNKDMTKELNFCRSRVENKWWLQDCACLLEVCQNPLRLDPDDQFEEVVEPCTEVTLEDSHITSHDGFDYATLDPINGMLSKDVVLPEGWEVCPDSKTIANQNIFATTECIVTMADHNGGDNVGTCEKNWQATDLIETRNLYRKCYRSGIDAKICIQRPTSVTCEAATMTWTVTENNSVKGEMKMENGNYNDVTDFITTLTPSSNKGTVAFATIDGASHVCLSAVSQTETKIEILTTPFPYGLSLVGHSTEMGTFMPLLRSDQFETTLKKSTESHGYCLRDVSLRPKMCLQMQSKGPLSLQGTQGLIEIAAEKTITFCPKCETTTA